MIGPYMYSSIIQWQRYQPDAVTYGWHKWNYNNIKAGNKHIIEISYDHNKIKEGIVVGD